jgi:hypothetical protein
VLIYKDDKDPETQSHAQITNDNKYLLISVSKGTNATNQLFYASMAENKALDKEVKFKPIVD